MCRSHRQPQYLCGRNGHSSSRAGLRCRSPCSKGNSSPARRSETQQLPNHHCIKNSRGLLWMSAFRAEMFKKIKRSSGYCQRWLRGAAQKDTKEGRISWTGRTRMSDLPRKLPPPPKPSARGHRASLNVETLPTGEQPQLSTASKESPRLPEFPLLSEKGLGDK